MRDLGFTVAFVLVTLSVLWIPIFIYALVRKSQGREPFAYEPAEEPEPAGQPGPIPWWAHMGLALIFILVLPVFLLMGLVFVPPVGLATLFCRMGERLRAKRLP